MIFLSLSLVRQEIISLPEMIIYDDEKDVCDVHERNDLLLFE